MWRIPSLTSFLRDCTGVMLLVAAILKLNLILDPTWVSTRTFIVQFGYISIILTELVIAGAVLLHLRRKYIDGIVVFLFALFAIFQLYSILDGARQCDCFGKLTVNPYYMLLIDVGIAFLFCIPPNPASPFLNRNRMRNFVSLGLLVSGCGYVVSRLLHEMPQIAASPESVRSEFEVLTPTKWIGTIPPLLEVIGVSPDVSPDLEGVRFIVIGRSDCESCIRLRAQVIHQSIEAKWGWFFVQLDRAPILETFQNKILQARKEVEWLCKTPVLVELSEGKVKMVYDHNFPLE